jgi:hypothetical protein
MARILKILAYAVILFLLYLVITGFLKSCNNDSKVASASVENTIESEKGEAFFEEEEFEGEENTLFADNVGEIEKIDYDKIDKAVEKRTKSNGEDTPVNVEKKEKPASPKPSTPQNYNSSSGNYLVIAGNYIINTNAENMVLKLKKNGYNNSEIVIFDMSQYHSVVANRFSDYNSAYNLAKQLEAKGIDSYVHRKK